MPSSNPPSSSPHEAPDAPPALVAGLRANIIDWLDDQYHFGDAASLITHDELSFLDHAILTSLGFVELLAWLEDTYQIQIDPADLSRENFDGMGKILRYIAPLVAATR